MANDFATGVMAGEEQKEKNPFNIIMNRFLDAQARRYKEDQARKGEEADLFKSLTVLNKDYLYKRELAKIEGEEKRKTKLAEQEGEITGTERLLKTFGMGGQSSLPPGTTAKIGNLTVPLVREYTEGESKTLSQAGSVIKQAAELKSILQGEIEQVKTGKKTTDVKFSSLFPFQAGSKEAQNYKLILDDMSDRILRLRSGAQINEREYSRLRKLLPKFGRYHEIDIKQLDKFTEEFEAIQGRIESGATWDNRQNKFIGEQEIGQQTNIPSFNSEQEALASGVKGMVIINGKKARID